MLGAIQTLLINTKSAEVRKQDGIYTNANMIVLRVPGNLNMY